jgi:hypothetical protein
MQNFLNLFTVLILFISLGTSSEVNADDLALFLKESMVNKVVSSKRVWEWKDEKQGVTLKLSDLKLYLKDDYILGIAHLDQFEKANTTQKNLSTIDKLMKKASQMQDIAVVQMVSQVGLSADHKKVILQNTKFTQFDNKYLPGFIEKGFLLGQVNARFAKEIDGKVIYEFPASLPFEITRLKLNSQAIEIYANLLMPCTL